MNYFSIAYKTALCALLVISNIFGSEHNRDLSASTFFDANELAEQNYRSTKQELNNKIKERKNIALEEWSNYLETEKNYRATIPTTEPRYNKLTQEIEKTKSRIQAKSQQLELKQLVAQQKEAVKSSPTLENLKGYQGALRNYIAVLPNEQMKIEPEKTLEKVDQEIKLLNVIHEDQNHLKNLPILVGHNAINPNSFKELSKHIEELNLLNNPKTLPTVKLYAEKIQEITTRLIEQIKTNIAFTPQQWITYINFCLPETDTILKPYREQAIEALQQKQAQETQPNALSKIKELQTLINNTSAEDKGLRFKLTEDLNNLKHSEEVKEMENVATKITTGEIDSTTLNAQELLKHFPVLSNFIAEKYYPTTSQPLYDLLQNLSKNEILTMIHHYEDRLKEDQTWLLLEQDNLTKLSDEEFENKNAIIENILRRFADLEEDYGAIVDPTKNKKLVELVDIETPKEEPTTTTDNKPATSLPIQYRAEENIKFGDGQPPYRVQEEQREIFEPLAQKTTAQTERIGRTKKSVQIQRNQPEPTRQPAPDNNEPWTFSGVAWSIVTAPFRLIGGVFSWLASWFA
jgi:hypothetical protein